MGRIKSFKKVANSSEDTMKLQDRLDEFFVPFTQCPLIDGVLLNNISLGSGSVNEIAHKLGREPLGWLVVRQRGNAQVWDTQDANTLKTKTLWLHSSANVSVDLWVF